MDVSSGLTVAALTGLLWVGLGAWARWPRAPKEPGCSSQDLVRYQEKYPWERGWSSLQRVTGCRLREGHAGPHVGSVEGVDVVWWVGKVIP